MSGDERARRLTRAGWIAAAACLAAYLLLRRPADPAEHVADRSDGAVALDGARRLVSLDVRGSGFHAVADVDGDGVRELVVEDRFELGGARGRLEASLRSGRTGEALVRYALELPTADWRAVERAGRPVDWRDGRASVATVGDVDGDGVEEVAIGTPYDDGGAPDAGAVRLLAGSTGAVIATWTGERERQHLGADVRAAGDRDGDGGPDVAVSSAPVRAPWSLPDRSSEDAQVRSGRSGEPIPGAALDGAPAREWTVDDVDGDGRDDRVVVDSARSELDFVLLRSRLGPLPLADPAPLAGHRLSGSGEPARTTGDFDGDGTPDLVFGCPRFTRFTRLTRLTRELRRGESRALPDELGGQREETGAAWVVSGRDGRLLAAFVPGTRYERWGASVAFLGDVDGDGLEDVAIGGVGEVHVFAGSRAPVAFAGELDEEPEP